MNSPIVERQALTVLVLGAHTGIGLATVKALTSAGHKTYGWTNTTDGATLVRQNGGIPVYGDVTRAGEIKSALAMSKADVLVNLAPQTFNDAPFSNSVWTTDGFLAETTAVLTACKEANIKFLVQTSFTAVYGDQHSALVNETHKPESQDNAFLKSAIKAENQTAKSGLAYSLLRLGYWYGGYSDGLNALSKGLRSGMGIASADNVVNWIHTEDAGEAIRRVVEAQPAGEILNITDGTPASTTEFVSVYSKLFGVVAPGQGFLSFLAGGTRTAHQNTVMHLAVKADNSKAKQLLGWTPKHSLEKGIEQALLIQRTEPIK